MAEESRAAALRRGIQHPTTQVIGALAHNLIYYATGAPCHCCCFYGLAGAYDCLGLLRQEKLCIVQFTLSSQLWMKVHTCQLPIVVPIVWFPVRILYAVVPLLLSTFLTRLIAFWPFASRSVQHSEQNCDCTCPIL